MLDIQGNAFLFLTWFISFILIKSLFKNSQSTLKLPPSPPLALPLLGHLHLLGPLLHQAFHKLSSRHGPLFHMLIGSKHVIVASSPEMAREIIKTNEESFCNRPMLISSEYLTYGTADYVFIPYGPYWRFMKKLCLTELLGGRTLEKFVSIRQEEIGEFLRSILQASHSNKPVEIRQELIKLTHNVISRMTIGKKSSETDDQVGKLRSLTREIGELVGAINLGDFIGFLKPLDIQGVGKKMKKVHQEMDAMMEEVIKEREESRMKMEDNGDRRKDLLDILIDLIAEENTAMKLSRESAKAFVLEMFIPGTNGPTSVIEWTLAELIRNPHILQKARREIDSAVGKNRLIKESDIQNLPYLQAIVKESMRLHPSTPIFGRECIKSCTIGGYDIPKNAMVMINGWAIARDPNYWDNPLEFRPERFMTEDEHDKRKLDLRGQYYQLLPFGSGRRGCPGASLALLVIQTTVASMIQCFDWNVNGGKNNEIDIAEKRRGGTTVMAKPLVCMPIAHFVPFSAV